MIFKTKKSVLIIDDEEDVRKLCGVFFEKWGFTVFKSDSGENALRVVSKSPPDLILLDVTMPEMDGYETCLTLKNSLKQKKTPIIFLSGLSKTRSVDKCFECGGDAYIIKPINWVLLKNKVEELLNIKI